VNDKCQSLFNHENTKVRKHERKKSILEEFDFKDTNVETIVSKESRHHFEDLSKKSCKLILISCFRTFVLS
jgi:hypothetical protein